MRMVVAGGGTGGHINPALVMAEEFRKMKHTVLFMGSTHGPERRRALSAGFEFMGIEVKGFNRSNYLKLLKALAILPAALLKARDTFAVFRPDAVLGAGGYASGPPAVAALQSGVPLFLLEQNVYPGLVTRWLAKKARKVYTSFSESERWFKRAELFYAGNPTRAGFARGVRKYDEKSVKTVLVMGGSQGARSINRAMVEALPLLKNARLKIYHQTGAGDIENVRGAYVGLGADATVEPYFEKMDKIMKTADFAVARAGAGTCAELTISGLPSILIPYPLAGGHQKFNADALCDGGAAHLLEDRWLTGKSLAERIRELMDNPETLEKMSANCMEMARPTAATIIAQDMEKTLEARWG